MRPSDEQRARVDVRLAAARIVRADADRDYYARFIGGRVAKGSLTPSAAAKVAGVSPRTIRRWRDLARKHGVGRKRR